MLMIVPTTITVDWSQKSFAGSFPASVGKARVGLNGPLRMVPSCLCIKCENSKKEGGGKKHKGGGSYERYQVGPDRYVSVERPPYYSYMDSISGELEPATGARASIPGQDYWPEGTASRVRAARAPEPTGMSKGAPSYGKTPGSRRKKNKAQFAASGSSEISVSSDDRVEAETSNDGLDKPKDLSSEFVTYQTEQEELTGYALDKKLGRPHPFIDPNKRKPIEEPLTSEELWWNWRRAEKGVWSRWQRRRPDVETVFLKAMAETGQIKLYGEHPTVTETALYRARRHVYKEERLQAEDERLHRIGPLAYYSEWVKAWTRDSSLEAVQKHFEETGEDEDTQVAQMFALQTDREYRIMMGRDIRIRRDPLAMRMREDQIKQIWGGDPVYPTVNYIQDPNEVTDFRGAEFHEPTPNMLDYLKECGKIITREELEKILAKEKPEELEASDMDEAMARAVDIGETDDEVEETEVEDGDKDEKVEESAVEDGDGDEDEKIARNWSVLKSTPQLRKSKGKPMKEDMSLEEAVVDSENLTDFLLDFDEEE
ncbi:protein PLASTID TRANSCRIPTIONALLY ACTIVE 12, chloroplastic [Rhododendron vialii]|uniref:protein PLASTID TRANSCRIPTIONALLY ACTIVE 12, chloroplastic n=1 Tax=Rhododendron vialii TaxID=182163 RepID=UPI00265E3D5A|nr:protein PLASTID TRANSCRIPTIONALLY ACTIVE 12, chloroplastic [Rhododendron vialii]